MPVHRPLADSSNKKKDPPSPPPPSGQKTGTYRDWVIDCTGDHERCPNLALASQGYQCTNLKGDKCCLTSDGQDCVAVDSVKDKGVRWDGELPKSADPPSPPPSSPSPPPPAPEKQQQQPEEQQPVEQQPQSAGAEVADKLAATVADAFAAAAAAAAGSAGGNRKLLLR